MFSARELLAVAVGLAAVAGCQKAIQPEVQQLSPAPILVDEAMTLREWEQVSSLYANGSSTAGPTLYPYVARRDVPAVEQYLVAPVLFYAQTAFLPINFISNPTWNEYEYRAAYYPPTYTAVPVVDPDATGYVAISRWDIPQPRRR